MIACLHILELHHVFKCCYIFFSNKNLYDPLWAQGSCKVYVEPYVIMVPLDNNLAQTIHFCLIE